MRKIKLLLMLAAMSMSVAMQAMQVYVNVPGQGTKTLEMEPSDSFENLKEKLEDKTSIPEASQSLFFNGILMLDDHTLYQDGVTNGSTLDLVIATVHTSLSMDDVIKLGDKLNIPVPGEYNYFGINGESCLYANNPYTLVRGNIVGDDYWDWTVTEAADGAYYIFKDVNGDLHPSHAKMAATSTTDGLIVDEVSSMEGLYHYFMIVHQRTEEFVDNVDGIEAGLAALVGQTTNLAISRQFYMDGYFNTLCLPISLDADAIAAHYWLGYNCEIFEFESATVNGGTLELFVNPVTAIEAGKPYLVRWAEDPWSPTIPGLYFEGVEIETSVGQAVGTGVQFVGSMGRTQLENGNHDYLFVGANNTLYWPNTDNKLKGFRAYFKVSGDVAPHGAPARMVIRKTTTGVDQITNDQSPMTDKFLRDGQLIILRNGVEYNANGQMVK